MMKNEIKQKVCIICKEPFTPHPKVGDRQQVCNKTYCKLQRKSLSQQNWLSKNPDYFKGRYPQLKEQILANKKQKAQSKPKACSGIQDKLTSNQNKLLTALVNLMSIQDEITVKITKSKCCLQDILDLVYKTS
jgi:hypothetical protein